MRRSAPRSLTSALERLTATLAPASTLARVQQVWEQAAGSALATAAKPTAERAGVLTVVCASSVWAQELDLMGPELLRSLNQALGQEGLVRELRCRTG